MFYSKSTGGFYTADIHGDNIPSDAVEITAEQHRALIEGQSSGKIIAADKNGFPMLQERPAPSAAELAAQQKAEASAYLASTDWYVTRKAETGADIPADVSTQRAAARVLLSQ